MLTTCITLEVFEEIAKTMDVKPFFAIEGLCFVGVWRLAQFALKILPEVSSYYRAHLHNALALKPSLQTHMVNVLHRSRAFARGKKRVAYFVFLHQTNTANRNFLFTEIA